MRPVDKGQNSKRFSPYGEARDPLGNWIGWYCSYCEMSVNNMIEVEHVVPLKKGGDEHAWENFLLSCKYCNTRKSDNNASRAGYLWPDTDNTDMAFEYSQKDIVKPRGNLSPQAKTAAQNTIELVKLDIKPQEIAARGLKDLRFMHRDEAWKKAKRSLLNWHASPSSAMADQIAMTAAGCGFYSVWCAVFANEPTIVEKIKDEFKGTYRTQFDPFGAPKKRSGGIF